LPIIAIGYWSMTVVQAAVSRFGRSYTPIEWKADGPQSDPWYGKHWREDSTDHAASEGYVLVRFQPGAFAS